MLKTGTEGEPRHTDEKREPHEPRHRWEFLRFERNVAEPQGEDAAGAERRNRQECPGKSRTQRREKVGDLQARDQYRIAKPRRPKEIDSHLPKTAAPNSQR